MSGTKVTTDPESQRNPISEGAGTITSDSLAGESLKSGGSFGATTGAAASGVPSKSTTTNNTDISGATTLAPAADAEARQAQEGWSETAALNAGRGLKENDAVIGTKDPSSGGAGTGTSGEEGTGGGAIGSSLLESIQKPKGANLTEGGFDGNEPNASFKEGVDSKKDPSRAAVQDMLKETAQAGGSNGPQRGGVSGDGQYDILKDSSA